MILSAKDQFQPVSIFSWDINRAERSRHVRWLAPLLERPDGRAWNLARLGRPCGAEDVQPAEPV